MSVARERQSLRVGLVLRTGADRSLLEASVAFHLRAGADAIAVWASADDAPGAARAVEQVEVDERVRRAPPSMASGGQVAAWAADDLALDWLIRTDTSEFWWPRGGSIREVLAAVPAGSDAAQGITRTLLPTTDDGRLDEHSILRLSPRAPSVERRWRPSRRFAVRSRSLDRHPSELDPLWGYYPFEVLALAGGGSIDPEREATRAAQELGVLVPDTRLRDVLHDLRTGPAARGAFSREGPDLAFPPPSPAEDALFALEAAVVDDLELSRAREELDSLSARLGELETSRFLRAEAQLRRALRPLGRALRRRR
jgi:hypothetical protein